MSESTEAVTEATEEAEKVSRIQFDPFENPGALAVEEAEWLNAEFEGLNISAGQVRAVISNHSRFQKSDSRKQNRAAGAQAKVAAKAERIAAAEQRKIAAEEKKAARDAAREERDAKAAAKKEADAAKAAEKAESVDTEALKAAAAPAKKTVKKRPQPVAAAADGF